MYIPSAFVFFFSLCHFAAFFQFLSSFYYASFIFISPVSPFIVSDAFLFLFSSSFLLRLLISLFKHILFFSYFRFSCNASFSIVLCNHAPISPSFNRCGNPMLFAVLLEGFSTTRCQIFRIGHF